MKESKTLSNGQKTAQDFQDVPLAILNKDPDSDYSFRRKKEIEAGGGVDRYGYEPITSSNSSGETWAGPLSFISSKTKAKGEVVLEDTILCKRPKEVSRHFQIKENERYNAQKMLIRQAAKNAQAKLRSVDPNAYVEDRSSGNFTQRPGPTEE